MLGHCFHVYCIFYFLHNKPYLFFLNKQRILKQTHVERRKYVKTETTIGFVREFHLIHFGEPSGVTPLSIVIALVQSTEK